MVRFREVIFTVVFAALTLSSRAQAPLPIYTDRLINGFQDWSWAPHNLSNPSPVHSGTNSISVTASAWQALSFWHSDLNAVRLRQGDDSGYRYLLPLRMHVGLAEG